MTTRDLARRGAWLFAGLVWASLAGCKSEADVHPFYAAQYDPEAQCFGPMTVNDILEGPEPGRCSQIVCWRNTWGDTYVSAAMCDGPPDWTKVEQPAAGSICEKAVAVFAKYGAGQCVPEGGDDSGDQESGL